MKKLLLTGASGFLGGHLVKKALHSYHVCAIYFSNNPADEKHWRKIDITNKDSLILLLDQFNPDIIIHCAANSNLDKCETDQDAAFQINVKVTENLARFSEEHKIRLINISSDMVFDGNGQFYKESDLPHPINYYGYTKFAAEKKVVSLCENYINVRLALLYGRPIFGGSSFSFWIENKLLNKQYVQLYTDQYRSPILANNAAAALLELAESDFCGTLHLAGANRLNRFSFGKQLCEAGLYDEHFLLPISMVDHHPPAQRPFDVSQDINLARQILKTELLDTKEGLKRMMSEM